MTATDSTISATDSTISATESTISATDSTISATESTISASDSTISASRQIGHRRHTELLTILHLASITSFLILLCWGYSGKTPINGDDVGVIHQRMMIGVSNWRYDYLLWTQRRVHIPALVFGNYKIAGDSIERGNLIWMSIYILSIFAAYAYLRKVVSPAVALLGTLFYLGYSSKYEPLTWWSAGAYTIVWLAFFGLLSLLESKIRFKLKATLIATIVLASMYVYEVLTLVAPMLSLLLLVRRKREVGVLRKQDWLFAALPTLVVIVHVGVLMSIKQPICLPVASTTHMRLEKRIFSGFTSALNATVGPLHADEAKRAGFSFRRFYAKEQPELSFIGWCAFAVTAVALVASLGRTLSTPVSALAVSEHALLGLGTLLFAASIGFVTNIGFTPSRLTGIPSIGFMIVVCGLLELCFCLARRLSGHRYKAMVAACCVLCCVVFIFTVNETQSLCGLLHQSSEVRDVDIAIASKIKQMHPTLGDDDEIFVRTPFARRWQMHAWTSFRSGFNNGRAFETFWYLYNQEAGSSRFSTTRAGSGAEPVEMAQVLQDWEKHGLNKVVPFYVDLDGNVFAIKKLDLLDADSGKLVRSIDFSSRHKSVPANLQIDEQIPVAQAPLMVHSAPPNQ